MIANFDVLFVIIFFMLDNNSQEIRDLISLYNLGDLRFVLDIDLQLVL